MVVWIEGPTIVLKEEEGEDLSRGTIYKLIKNKIEENRNTEKSKMICCSHPKLTEEQEARLVDLRDQIELVCVPWSWTI